MSKTFFNFSLLTASFWGEQVLLQISSQEKQSWGAESKLAFTQDVTFSEQ